MFESQHQHVMFPGLWPTYCLILKKGLPLKVVSYLIQSYLCCVSFQGNYWPVKCEYDIYSWCVHACSAKFFDDLISVENGDIHDVTSTVLNCNNFLVYFRKHNF